MRQVDFVAVTASRYYAPVALGIWLANWETGCTTLGIPGRCTVPATPQGRAGYYGASCLKE